MSAPTDREDSREAVTQGQALDDALAETFPASDPIALAPKRGGKDDKRVDCLDQPKDPMADTTDEKTTSNIKALHKAFERRR